MLDLLQLMMHGYCLWVAPCIFTWDPHRPIAWALWSVWTGPNYSNGSSMLAVMCFLSSIRSLALYFCYFSGNSRTLKYKNYWKPSKDSHNILPLVLHTCIYYLKKNCHPACKALPPVYCCSSSPLDLTIICFWSKLTAQYLLLNLHLKEFPFSLKLQSLFSSVISKPLLGNLLFGPCKVDSSRQ